jgi:hypothetical protein
MASQHSSISTDEAQDRHAPQPSVWGRALRRLAGPEAATLAGCVDAAVQDAARHKPRVFSPEIMNCDDGAVLLGACAIVCGFQAELVVGFFEHHDPHATYFHAIFGEGSTPQPSELPWEEHHHWVELTLDRKLLRLDPNGDLRFRDHVQCPPQPGYRRSREAERLAYFPSGTNPFTLPGQGIHHFEVALEAARQASSHARTRVALSTNVSRF